MSTADILINSGYLLTLIALSIKEVLWLRVVLTCSHCMIFVNNFFKQLGKPKGCCAIS